MDNKATDRLSEALYIEAELIGAWSRIQSAGGLTEVARERLLAHSHRLEQLREVLDDLLGMRAEESALRVLLSEQDEEICKLRGEFEDEWGGRDEMA